MPQIRPYFGRTVSAEFKRPIRSSRVGMPLPILARALPGNDSCSPARRRLPLGGGRRFDEPLGMLTFQLLQMVAEPIDVVAELLRNRPSNRAHLVDQGVGRHITRFSHAHSS